MSDIYVVYFSSTGNTEEMAKHVADGIERKGGNPVLTEIGSADPDHLKEASAFALGCPACGAEELDESMESLIEEISDSLEGKHVGLFGSYGWGGGDWMREWEKRMAERGAKIVGGEGVIALESPDGDAEKQLKNLGEALAELGAQA